MSRIWLMVVMCAAALSMLMIPATVTAQPSTAPVQPEPPAAKDGADSAKACAEMTLESMKKADADALLKIIPPAQREMAARYLKVLLQAIAIKRYKIGEITDNGDDATVKYEWEATVDIEKMIAKLVEMMTQMMEEQGMDKDQIKEQLELAKQVYTMQAEQMKKMIERKNQTMHISKIDGRWYCQTPMDPSEHDENEEGGMK